VKFTQQDTQVNFYTKTECRREHTQHLRQEFFLLKKFLNLFRYRLSLVLGFPVYHFWVSSVLAYRCAVISMIC